MQLLIILAIASLAVCAPVKNSCSGGDWFRCAGTVADCWQQCSDGVFTKVCMDCCGGAWDSCAKCFSEPRADVVKFKTTYSFRNAYTPVPNSCSGGDWFRCAGVVADCWSQCSDAVFTKTCMDCCGDAWDTCSKCFNAKTKTK